MTTPTNDLYRVGNHNPNAVWYDPDRTYAKSQPVCTAMRLLNQSRKAFITLWHEHETPVRRREYMRRVRTPDTVQPCSTVAAYNRHVRRREATCEECRAAVAAYQRARVSARQAELDQHDNDERRYKP